MEPQKPTQNDAPQNLNTIESESHVVAPQTPEYQHPEPQQGYTAITRPLQSNYQQGGTAQPKRASKSLFFVLVLVLVVLLGGTGYFVWQTLEATSAPTVQTGGDAPDLERKADNTQQ